MNPATTATARPANVMFAPPKSQEFPHLCEIWQVRGLREICACGIGNQSISDQRPDRIMAISSGPIPLREVEPMEAIRRLTRMAISPAPTSSKLHPSARVNVSRGRDQGQRCRSPQISRNSGCWHGFPASTAGSPRSRSGAASPRIMPCF